MIVHTQWALSWGYLYVLHSLWETQGPLNLLRYFQHYVAGFNFRILLNFRLVLDSLFERVQLQSITCHQNCPTHV